MLNHRFSRLTVAALVLLLCGSWADATPAFSSRTDCFRRVMREELLNGDRAGARLLEMIGKEEPSVPPPLSSAAAGRLPEYAARYAEFRIRLTSALEKRDYLPAEQWRVDRAEANLHAIAYELAQGENANLSIVQRLLADTNWALDHTIAVTAASNLPLPTVEMRVTPATILPDESALLSWKSDHATAATLDGRPVAPAGSLEVAPERTHEYRIVASNARGQATASAVVTVQPPPTPTATISVTPRYINRGDSARLEWHSRFAEEAVINGRRVPLEGARDIYPDTPMTFTLAVRGPGGRAASVAQVDLFTAAPLIDLKATPDVINRGECAELTWRVFNATEFRLEGERLPLIGSRRVCPTGSRVYAATARGEGGSTIAEAAITVRESTPEGLRIYFDHDEWTIRADALAVLADLARRMRERVSLRIRIEGHCDNTGSPEYNQRLSERRAEAVRDFIVSQYGIEPLRFETIGRGELLPAAPNSRSDGADFPEGRQQNRRAEFIELP